MPTDRIFSSTLRRVRTPFDLSPIETFTSNVTLDGSHGTVIGDTTSGNVTITLPTAAQHSAQQYLVIKKVAANTLSIRRSGTDTVGFAGNVGVDLANIDEQAIVFSGGADNVWHVCGCGSLTLVPNTVADVMTIRSAAHNSSITISNFLSFGNPSRTETTHAAAKIKIPRAITLTRLSGLLNAALTGGQTASLRFNINGTTSSTISLDYTSADSTGVAKGAGGSLAVASGDELSIEVVLGGGATSVQVRGLGVAYTVAPE